MDLFDRSVVPSITDRNITNDLAIRTLQKALDPQQVQASLILQSDQDSQFTSLAFTDFCAAKCVTQSMSKAGCPCGNAPMGRYFNTLKNEYTDLFDFPSEELLYRTAEEFACVSYNHLRPHTCNAYRSPCQTRSAHYNRLCLSACLLYLFLMSLFVTMLLDRYSSKKRCC